MAKPAELVLQPRQVSGKATKQLRKTGVIPANIFGRGEPSIAVQVEEQAFQTLRKNHRATGLITLKLAGEKKSETALIRHVQRDGATGKLLHIDFFRVNTLDRITSKVPLHFVGVAPGVKIEGGILLHLVDHIEVECAAGDIVEAIEVDITPLEKFEDTLHASDIKLPPNFVLLTEPEEAIVKVAPPRVEKAEEAAEAAPVAIAPAPVATEPTSSEG
jgi:large subunit ribosomal protein L25